MPKNKKPKKDPMAPKRNQSAYIMFQNHMREAFMEANPRMVRNSNIIFIHYVRYNPHN